MNESAFEDDWSSPEEDSAPKRSRAEPDQGVERSRPASSGRPGSAADWRASAARRARDERPRSELPVPVPERPQVPMVRRSYGADPYAGGSGYGESPSELRIDLRKYLWLAIKHRWLILGSVGVCLVLGLLVTFLTTPIYRATTSIQISRQADKIVQMDDVQSNDGLRSEEFYQTQYELLQSRSLAERVVAKLNLQDNPEFMQKASAGLFTRLRQAIFGGGSDKEPDVASRQRQAASRVMAGLSIDPIRTSSIVTVSFDSPNADLAKTVVDAVAEGFIAANLDRRFDASSYARTFLEERLEQLKAKLAETERELVAYAEKEHIVGTGDSQNLAMTNLSAANDALGKATSERLRTELLWQNIQQSTGLGLPQFLENETVRSLREKKAGLDADYKDRLSVFKPAFPEMKKLKAQIDEVESQIATEVALIKDSVKAQYDNALGEERSLAAHVEELKREVTDFRNRNIQYNILQREVDTNRSLYDGLLQRYKEIGVAGGVGANNISIVDKAERPHSPYTPKLSRNLAIALFLGLMIGGLAAVGREQFDDTFKSPEDVEEYLGLPLLGIIPLATESTDPRAITDDPRSPVAEAYRSLRTALQFSTPNGVPRTLLVTSSRPSEGKSTTAIVLARTFAELGLNVLLIDSDLRKPALHTYLDVDPSRGLTNYLAGAASPPELFQSTDQPGLTVLTAGPLAPNPAELLAGPRMLSLLTIAAERYDLVVVDGPPVVGLADAPLLSSIALGTLVVVDSGATRRTIVRTAVKRLMFARAQIVGVVVNKLNTRRAGYGYGYGYGYGKEEGAYYGVTSKPAERLTDGRTGDEA
jgi:succinoglycan biosynthesis transport protein ExoP